MLFCGLPRCSGLNIWASTVALACLRPMYTKAAAASRAKRPPIKLPKSVSNLYHVRSGAIRCSSRLSLLWKFYILCPSSEKGRARKPHNPSSANTPTPASLLSGARLRAIIPLHWGRLFQANTVAKKYQIFVSSTYTDLIVERQAVLRSILDLGHIPSGMEIFSAADNEQFKAHPVVPG
jgi:hypothetical protein